MIPYLQAVVVEEKNDIVLRPWRGKLDDPFRTFEPFPDRRRSPGVDHDDPPVPSGFSKGRFKDIQRLGKKVTNAAKMFSKVAPLNQK